MRSATLPGYVNAFELCPEEPRVFGTESMCADWDGGVLILTNAFACSATFRGRLRAGDARPYRHDETSLLSRKLERLIAPLRRSDAPETCGALYASALGCMLRDDDATRPWLPNRRAALEFGRRVVAFTLDHMSALRAVVCLDKDAWECAASLLGAPEKRDEFLASARPHRAGDVRLFAAHHPLAFRTTEEQRRAWNGAARALADAEAA